MVRNVAGITGYDVFHVECYCLSLTFLLYTIIIVYVMGKNYRYNKRIKTRVNT